MQPLENLFEAVIAPDYSKKILLKFQEKYNLNSTTMWARYITDQSLNIPKDDLEYWFYHYEIFTTSGGDIRELI